MFCRYKPSIIGKENHNNLNGEPNKFSCNPPDGSAATVHTLTELSQSLGIRCYTNILISTPETIYLHFIWASFFYIENQFGIGTEFIQLVLCEQFRGFTCVCCWIHHHKPVASEGYTWFLRGPWWSARTCCSRTCCPRRPWRGCCWGSAGSQRTCQPQHQKHKKVRREGESKGGVKVRTLDWQVDEVLEVFEKG